MPTLYDLFAATARRQPRHPALLGPGPQDELSYADLDREVCAVADRLKALGVGAGDYVGLHCPSGREYIILTYALWRRAACVVPIPTELAPGEKLEILQRIALTFVITDAGHATLFASFTRGQAAPLQGRYHLCAVTSPRSHPPEIHDIASAFIRFTSGTTGAAKGVVLSHDTIRDRIEAANEVLRLGPADRIVWLLSMSYHFAVSIVSYLTFGATVVLVPNSLGATVLQAAHHRRGTVIYASPLHYAWMTAAAGPNALSSLRLAVSTTTALDEVTAHRFHFRFGIPLAQALGVIEIGLPCINVDFALEAPEGVGRVLPAYQMKLCEIGLGPHQQEICFRGKGILDAYYDPWQPRTAFLRNGWFHTGDVGELDSAGCLFVRGRIKDVINVGGMKLFPQEVEAVLLAHPAVASACVLPSPDERMGEVPMARVELQPGTAPAAVEEELLAICRQRLAAYKVPQRIELVASLKRTASGKVMHRDGV
jgi:long-chain acyl-CoA synthetase